MALLRAYIHAVYEYHMYEGNETTAFCFLVVVCEVLDYAQLSLNNLVMHGVVSGEQGIDLCMYRFGTLQVDQTRHAFCWPIAGNVWSSQEVYFDWRKCFPETFPKAGCGSRPSYCKQIKKTH